MSLPSFNKLLSSWLFGLLILFVFYYCLIDNIYSFNYETFIHEQYRLNFLIFLILLIYGLRLNELYNNFNLTKFTLLLIMSSIMILSISSSSFSYSNEYFFNIIFFIFLFSTILLLDFSNFILIIVIALSVAYIAELFLGLYQLVLISPSSINRNFYLTGTFQNSGIYSCFLVIGLPLINYLVLHLQQDILKLLSFAQRDLNSNIDFHRIITFNIKSKLIIAIIFIIVAIILIFSQSRTAIIAYFIITLILGYSYVHKNGNVYFIKYKKLILFLSFFSFSVCLFLLSGFKKASAIGRYFIDKIILLHIRDNLFSGVGIGKFTWYYPQWQSNYFKYHPCVSPDFYFCASETYIAFNEYLQTFKEIGLIGFCLLAFLFTTFFFCYTPNYKNLLSACKYTVITILICCMTSYPLHINFLLYVLGFCFTVVFYLNKRKFLSQNMIDFSASLKKSFIVAFMMLFIVFTIIGVNKGVAAENWSITSEVCTFNRSAIKVPYAQLYKNLNNDGKFLTEYGEFLLTDNSDWRSTVKILELARTKLVTVKTLETLAHAYSNNNKKKAIDTYIWLTNYIPNKFRFRNNLLMLYQANGDTINAINTAKQIISMPVKVPSTDVRNFKTQASQYLDFKSVKF
jgi:hypothetical protein